MSHWENNGRSDEWYTPKYIFDALETWFDLDVAAPVDRTYCCVPAREFYTEGSLDKSWIGYVWMNPPFGGRNGIEPWLKKMTHNWNGIALTPDRTSAPWWQWTASKSDAVLFIKGKVKFVRPDGTTGDSPSNGTTLFGWGDLAIRHLQIAEKNNLGKLYLNTVKP